ncbi:hypothetical protein B4134_2106 [Bacillus safensis]|nr:hypothetical protein B4134_2106 [Bacillus safensis]
MIAPLSVFFLYTDKLHVRFRKRFIFHSDSPKKQKNQTFCSKFGSPA